MTPFRAGVLLRCLNLVLCLLWLLRLRWGGLLVTLTVPAAALGLYAAGNSLLAALREDIKPAGQTTLASVDLGLLAWVSIWTHAPLSEAALGFIIPVLVAGLTLGPGSTAIVTVVGLGSLAALANWGMGPSAPLAPRLSVLLITAAAALVLNRAALGTSSRTGSPLGRGMLFNEFLSHILFQMREYLTSITTVTGHLAISAKDSKDRDMSAKLEKMIAELNAKVGRMLETVKVNTTTRSTGRQVDFEIKPLLEECLAAARAPHAGVDVDVRIVCDGDVGGVRGDRDMLVTIFHAVLSNSFEALSSRDKSGHLLISARREKKAVKVEIIDDGGGIPAGGLKNVFQPLHTTKASRGCVGLGLSMSRRMLERSGGTLSLESAKGKTAVRVTVPLKPALPIIRNEDSSWAQRRGGIK